MKITDSIFKIMMGLSILILSVSLLVFATKSSYANDNSATTPYMPAEGGAASKYTLQYNSGVDGNGNFYWQMVLFNRESGAYRAYQWDNGGWSPLFPGHQAFPEFP
ncbi:MAG: hypothetical protein IPH24_04245 [Crocinitomicaceae bacterium]|jgi:hypothetical protein|nr:hypothetical protein [Crocinitomicaceae bacterium]